MDLNQETMIYPEHTISCKSEGCKTDCSSPEPFMKRIVGNETVGYEVQRVEEDELILRQQISTTITVLTSKLKGSAMEVIKAKCEFKVSYAWGCKDCLINSEIVLQPINMEKGRINETGQQVLIGQDNNSL